MAKKQNKQHIRTPQSSEIAKVAVSQSPMPAFAWKLHWIPIFIFVILSILIYARCIPYGYALDDQMVLSENKFVQKGFAGLGDIFSKESFLGYFGEQKNLVVGARYRPLTIGMFAVEHAFFGKNAAVNHAINILWYILTVLMIYRLFILCNPKWIEVKSKFLNIAFLTALLFLIHPTHTEAVANIKGRDEIVCLFFSLLAVFYYIKAFDKQSTVYAWIAGISLLLGLFSKENAITFLAILPLSLWIFRTPSIGQSLKYIIPAVILSIVYLIIRTKVVGFFLFSPEAPTAELMNDPFVEMNIGQKLATIFYTLIWYIKLLFVPYPLTHDYYPYHVPLSNWTDFIPIVSLVVYAVLGIVGIKNLKQKSILSYSILFFLATMSIVSNLVFPVGTFMNERFLFMPSVGFCLLAAYYIMQIIDSAIPWKKLAGQIGLGIIGILFVGISFFRIPAWQSGDTLNYEGIKVSKNSARLNMFTGVSYFQTYQKKQDPVKRYKDLELAEQYMKRALEIYPTYHTANNMLAGVAAEWHKKDNNLDRILSTFKEICARNASVPFMHEYLKYFNGQPDKHATLIAFYKQVGFEILYKQQQKFGNAITFLSYAYNLNKDDAEINYMAGRVYQDWANDPKLLSSEAQQYKQKATEFLQKATMINPTYGQ